MYEELTERLRTCGSSLSCNKCKWLTDCDGISESLQKAADVIEEQDMCYRHLERDYKNLCAYLPRWIPVTEKLPEKDGPCLCWLTYTVYPNPGPGVTRVCCDVIYFDVKSKSWLMGFKYPRSPKVLAWMPLPEPPKESI